MALIVTDLKRFPQDLNTFAWKSQKSQKWNTVVKESTSGHIRTLSQWARPRWVITASFTYLTPEEHRRLFGFFASLKGGALPFLWLDPEDNTERGAVLGRGRDGAWTAVRRFGDFIEPADLVEDVKLYADGKPVAGVKVTDGNRLTVTGTVPADAVITADYRYWWKVRLADDAVTTEAVYAAIFKTKSFKLESVL